MSKLYQIGAIEPGFMDKRFFNIFQGRVQWKRVVASQNPQEIS